MKKHQLSEFFDAVFFDMDGLLVDSEPIWFESERRVTSEHGYEWSHEDQLVCLGGPLWRVGQYMYERCGEVETPTYFTEKLIDTQCSQLKGRTPLMPGAIELLSDLFDNGVATGLVSASPRIIVEAVLENLGGNPFPFSISSDDVVNTKPNPDAYLLAAAKADARIDHSLIFEDSFTGITAAKASGAWLIAVPQLIDVVEGERVRSVKSLEQISFAKLQRLFRDFSSDI